MSYSSTDSESSSGNETNQEDENWYETGMPVHFISTGIATTTNVSLKDSQEQAIERSLVDNFSYSGHKKILDDLEDSVSQGTLLHSL